MSSRQMFSHHHGTGVYSDFPDTRPFPWLIKDLNRVLKAVGTDSCLIILKVDSEHTMEFDIVDNHALHPVTISYKDYIFKFDLFIIELVKRINTHLIHRFSGYGIVPLRMAPPASDLNVRSFLYFTFASRMDIIKGIPGYNILGSADDYIPLIPEEAQAVPLIPMPSPFDQLDVKHKSKQFDNTHHLFIDADMPEVLQDEIEGVLKLNPSNKISVNIKIYQTKEVHLAKAELIFTLNNIQTIGLVDRWAFAELGNQINQLLNDNDRRYCLLEPNESNYVYAYCTKEEFELLKENEYVHENYMNTFEKKIG
jgi:hypothetical protein